MQLSVRIILSAVQTFIFRQPGAWNSDRIPAFGNVECKGQGSSDPDAPCVELQISSSFGQTCIILLT